MSSQFLTLNIFLVEDDPLFAIKMEAWIQALGHQLMRHVTNAPDAIAWLDNHSPDVILMDISIDGDMTGIELAQEISESGIPIIFITSFQEDFYYEQAKKLNPVGYLTKGFDRITLRAMLELSVARQLQVEASLTTRPGTETGSDIRQDKEEFFIQCGNEWQKVRIEEIVYIQSTGNYCIINTETRQFVMRISLIRILEMLESSAVAQQNGKELFLRVHKSYVIHLGRLTQFDTGSGMARLSTVEVPVSRRFRPILLRLLHRG